MQIETDTIEDKAKEHKKPKIEILLKFLSFQSFDGKFQPKNKCPILIVLRCKSWVRRRFMEQLHEYFLLAIKRHVSNFELPTPV